MPLRSRSPKIRATDYPDRRRGSHRFHRFSQIRTRDGRFDRMISRRSKAGAVAKSLTQNQGHRLPRSKTGKPQIPPIFTDSDTGRTFRSDDFTTFQTPLPLRSHSPKIRATDYADRRPEATDSTDFHRFGHGYIKTFPNPETRPVITPESVLIGVICGSNRYLCNLRRSVKSVAVAGGIGEKRNDLHTPAALDSVKRDP